MTTDAAQHDLSDIGYRIFLDRYAKKDIRRESMLEGSIVLACVDPQRGHREVGRIVERRGDDVVVEFGENGTSRRVNFSYERLDRPIELDPREMHDRVASSVASVEVERDRWARTFRDLLGYFTPAGRILAAVGVEEQLCAVNCFVVPNPSDSLEGIYGRCLDMVKIMRRGGGVGLNLSSLRPRGAYVKTVNGRSSGAVGWSALYSVSTGLIEQGGSRRGAQMAILEIWHPDIEEFIHSKRSARFNNNCNQSVGITDDFMAALDRDDEWSLVFPDTKHPAYEAEWGGDIAAWRARHPEAVVVYKTMKARDLWRQIIESAHASAEPGLWFKDRCNKAANSYYYPEGVIVAPNPCFTGDARIATQYGLVSIADLAGKRLPLRVTTDARVQPGYLVGEQMGVEVRDAVPAFRTSEQEDVWRVTTRHGYGVVATAYHKFVTPGGFVELKDLEVGGELLIQSDEGQWGSEGSSALGAVIGFLEGDGNWGADGSAVLRFYGDKAPLADEMLANCRALVEGRESERYDLNIVEIPSRSARSIESVRVARVLAEYGYREKGRVPEVIWRGTRDTVAEYLRWLFAADGTVNWSQKSQSCSARFNQSDPTLLRDLQVLLLNFGIVSKLYKRREAGWKRMPDGEGGSKDYFCQENFDLVVEKQNLQRFAEIVGFARAEHRERFEKWASGLKRGPYRETFVDEIASIEYVGREPVYCTTQETHHTVVANGIVTGQCAEEPLPAWGVCNLGHLQLQRFAVGPIGSAKVDWTKLAWATSSAVRFLDDVIDYTHYYDERTERQQKSERRVGLGTLGLAELMIRCGVRYGAGRESLAFLDELYGFIAQAAYVASADLAREKGSFPKFDADKFVLSGFMQSMPETMREYVRQHGCRNVTLLTQAPCGTVATMLGTSSGIEPFFDFSWKRNSRVGNFEERASVVGEWRAQHPAVVGVMTEEPPLPDYFVTAQEFTPADHAHTQAQIQKWVDAAISKTSNLPADYTVEQVGEYYRLLYDLGCKGGTVYRDGSREEQILERAVERVVQQSSVQEEPSAIVEAVQARLREVVDLPDSMLARKERVRTPMGTLHVTASYLDGEPREAFSQIGKGGSDVYADLEAINRLISLVLRLDSPVPPARRLQLIADNLEGIGGRQQEGFGPNKVLSVPDGLAQALKRLPLHYECEQPARPARPVEVAAAATTGNGKRSAEHCPKCLGGRLVHQEGCRGGLCQDCGYSAC